VGTGADGRPDEEEYAHVLGVSMALLATRSKRTNGDVMSRLTSVASNIVWPRVTIVDPIAAPAVPKLYISTQSISSREQYE
jgi:hypothetical protein